MQCIGVTMATETQHNLYTIKLLLTVQISTGEYNII
ncbi:hypothetical protein SAMN05421857_2979 [Chryseobacterium formosense]|nr:hypothetical protein SAMN05421857_2979 [Chryseobacterium formosense]